MKQFIESPTCHCPGCVITRQESKAAKPSVMKDWAPLVLGVLAAVLCVSWLGLNGWGCFIGLLAYMAVSYAAVFFIYRST